MIVHDDDNDDDGDDWRMIACSSGNDNGDDDRKMIDATAKNGEASGSRSLNGVSKDARQCQINGTPLFPRTDGQNKMHQNGDHTRVPSTGEWLSIKADDGYNEKPTIGDQATGHNKLSLTLTRFAKEDQEGIIIQHDSEEHGRNTAVHHHHQETQEINAKSMAKKEQR